MAIYNRAEPVALKRNKEFFLYEDDGVTPAPAATLLRGVRATRKISGATGVMAPVTLMRSLPGTAQNAYSIEFAADGSGAGSVTTSGGGLAIKFHFQAGITTIANAQAALGAYMIVFLGSFTPSNLLTSPGDVFGPLLFAGGANNSMFVRQGDVTWAAALGADPTNTGVDGDWIYQYLQTELDFVGSEVSLRVTKDPDAAYLDLSGITAHVDTIVYDKFTPGRGDPSDPTSGGDACTLQFISDGTGAGTLNESAYPAVVFHFQSGVTTVNDFENAVVASTKLGIKQYGKWTNIFAGGDVLAPTHLHDGRSYKQEIYPDAMCHTSPDLAGVENGHTMWELLRLLVAGIYGPATDFTTTTIAVKSLDGTKTRGTVTTDDTGRLTFTYGDLS